MENQKRKKINPKNISNGLIESVLYESFKEMDSFQLLLFYLKIEKNLTLKEISNKLVMSYEGIRCHLKKIFKIIENNLEKRRDDFNI